MFGALLGPEATGPGFVVFGCGFWYLGVSGFLSVPVMCWLSLRGWLVCGVCGSGLLFENYIVDASI